MAQLNKGGHERKRTDGTGRGFVECGRWIDGCGLRCLLGCGHRRSRQKVVVVKMVVVVRKVKDGSGTVAVAVGSVSQVSSSSSGVA